MLRKELVKMKMSEGKGCSEREKGGKGYDNGRGGR